MEGASTRERRRPGGARPPVGGAGGRGEEKTAQQWLGGAVAGSVSVTTVEGGTRRPLEPGAALDSVIGRLTIAEGDE